MAPTVDEQQGPLVDECEPVGVAKLVDVSF